VSLMEKGIAACNIIAAIIVAMLILCGRATRGFIRWGERSGTRCCLIRLLFIVVYKRRRAGREAEPFGIQLGEQMTLLRHRGSRRTGIVR